MRIITDPLRILVRYFILVAILSHDIPDALKTSFLYVSR